MFPLSSPAQTPVYYYNFQFTGARNSSAVRLTPKINPLLGSTNFVSGREVTLTPGITNSVVANRYTVQIDGVAKTMIADVPDTAVPQNLRLLIVPDNSPNLTWNTNTLTLTVSGTASTLNTNTLTLILNY
jgi:hypothetical protein